jgi:LPXTG-motif cell wall-anchored protein
MSLPGVRRRNGSGGSKGLDTGAKTAIAVVIPVVGIALILLAALFFWRKRKAKKVAEEQRRKEVEDYGFNPNNDPTLPAVGSEAGGPEMSEDHSSGYRGWGAATASHRKGSTTMSGGHTQGQLSETGSNPFTGSSPSGTNPDAPMMRDTMSSDELGALGAAPVAGTAAAAGNMRRGPSNASSRYSNGAHSDGSGPEEPGTQGGAGQPYDYGYGQSGPYGQTGPYGDGSYGGAGSDMPIVRDVSARRNTRIQQASGPYQQGNSGIAQNF